MTHAELLRSHADLAIKEGGMYYSGEYLSRIATVAESLEAENAKLRELLRTLAFCADDRADCDQCAMNGKPHVPVPQSFCDEMAELLRQHGVEVG